MPYPINESPSQRFRFEQYFGVLSKQGYSCHVQSFLDSQNWRLFFNTGNALARVVALLKGFLKRVFILFQITRYDFVFIHREASPIGPPVFEWIIANVFQKKIIYDFDDAIWLTDRTHESWIFKTLKWRGKVKHICRWSYRVSCGNNYLASFAKEFNTNVNLNPTTIDTDLHKPGLSTEKIDSITIGWTGSHSTIKYLSNLKFVFKELEKDFPSLQFIIIADTPPSLNLKSAVFIPWSLQSEISDLRKIAIGIMPLPDDEWSKGKCGFKALQYMALQIPVIASPVGMNYEIIEPGINGFLAASNEEWILYLSKLLQDPQLRHTMGHEGRKKIMKSFSVKSNLENFIGLFR